MVEIGRQFATLFVHHVENATHVVDGEPAGTVRHRQQRLDAGVGVVGVRRGPPDREFWVRRAWGADERRCRDRQLALDDGCRQRVFAALRDGGHGNQTGRGDQRRAETSWTTAP